MSIIWEFRPQLPRYLYVVSMHICVRYEGSVRQLYWKRKWLPFKKYRSYWPNMSCACTRGICLHICAKYEVSKIKSVASKAFNREWQNQKPVTGRKWHTTDSSLCKGSLALIPDEPIIDMNRICVSQNTHNTAMIQFHRVLSWKLKRRHKRLHDKFPYLRIGMKFIMMMWRLFNRSPRYFVMFKQVVILQTSNLKNKNHIKVLVFKLLTAASSSFGYPFNY